LYFRDNSAWLKISDQEGSGRCTGNRERSSCSRCRECQQDQYRQGVAGDLRRPLLLMGMDPFVGSIARAATSQTATAPPRASHSSRSRAQTRPRRPSHRANRGNAMVLRNLRNLADTTMGLVRVHQHRLKAVEVLTTWQPAARRQQHGRPRLHRRHWLGAADDVGRAVAAKGSAMRRGLCKLAPCGRALQDQRQLSCRQSTGST
jgi:hypothetical protein